MGSNPTGRLEGMAYFKAVEKEATFRVLSKDKIVKMYVMEDYDQALRLILDRGVKKTNRTGEPTLAVMGIESRYRIDESFPFVTGRKLRFKSMIGELLWFLEGSTNNNRLKELGCSFWTPWVSEEFERKHQFEPGSFGPVYGFQLRYFGGCYNKGIEKKPGYGHDGFDQLAYIMDLLKNDPFSRRILFSLWNPKQMDQMRLPPCHYTFQLFVDDDGRLSGELTQRSCDFPVGVPFNVAFYSTLIYMFAQQAGFRPYEFIHNTADSHIYQNQIPAVEEYLARTKPDSPKLETRKAEDIYSYTPDDFNLVDYNPGPAIKIPVAV